MPRYPGAKATSKCPTVLVPGPHPNALPSELCQATLALRLSGHAFLQVRQQTLYILQVLPSGRFVKVQSIGALCNDDDQLMLEMHEEQERQWQAQRFQVDILAT